MEINEWRRKRRRQKKKEEIENEDKSGEESLKELQERYQ